MCPILIIKAAARHISYKITVFFFVVHAVAHEASAVFTALQGMIMLPSMQNAKLLNLWTVIMGWLKWSCQWLLNYFQLSINLVQKYVKVSLFYMNMHRLLWMALILLLFKNWASKNPKQSMKWLLPVLKWWPVLLTKFITLWLSIMIQINHQTNCRQYCCISLWKLAYVPSILFLTLRWFAWEINLHPLKSIKFGMMLLVF